MPSQALVTDLLAELMVICLALLWQASEPVEQNERLRSRGRNADAEPGKLRVPYLDALLPAFELAQEQAGERLFNRLFQNPLVLKRFFG